MFLYSHVNQFLEGKELALVYLLIEVASITAMIFFTFNSSSHSSIYDIHIHFFIFILHRFITNQLNHQLPVGLLAQKLRLLLRGSSLYLIVIFLFCCFRVEVFSRDSQDLLVSTTTLRVLALVLLLSNL